jgi:acetyl/propionyl-CoA carboxylase alpha subunit
MIDRNGHRTPFHRASSAWARDFTLADLKCLIVCRGPVRKEAIETFEAAGLGAWGILLSEKDSISYTHCLAPELRDFRFPERVHRVPDYTGATQEERQERIAQIIRIAEEGGYTHIFAGYGFMAEDAEFIEAIENSKVAFMGPCANVARRAGSKDESKKTARALGVSVVPGVDDISARALLRKAGSRAALPEAAKKAGLHWEDDGEGTDEDAAEALLQAGYRKRVELVTVTELQDEAAAITAEMWKQHPGRRIRFKHIGGGGGKGQRIVSKPEDIPGAVKEVLGESKAMAPGSNRNFLLELNIETSRHNEIQLLGNGRWCIALGGRDCSLQMHEQKLLEFSLTQELLATEIAASEGKRRAILEREAGTLGRMEADAEAFGGAIGLDSVSTYECIVDEGEHWFMEMNTRIQVEHRVTELAYSLEFTNPEDKEDRFVIDSLIEAMALMAAHGDRVPKPRRIERHTSGIEARINATNRALQPHAGGLLQWWSPPVEGEIRDDQGIGVPNSDTGLFLEYALAGAYDSNIALVLTDGENRRHNLERLADILRHTDLGGRNVETNLDVHYGLIGWILGKDPMFQPTTAFMGHYLAGVGALAKTAGDIDPEVAWKKLVAGYSDAEARAALDKKTTLLIRPLAALLDDPHLLAGFVGQHAGRLWTGESEFQLAVDPAAFLDATYRYLGLDPTAGKTPAERIWDHDQALLGHCRSFYETVADKLGTREWPELRRVLEGDLDARVAGDDAALWQRCRSAHRGFLVGMELLLLPARIAAAAEFSGIGIDEELRPVVPERFRDPAQAKELTKALAPPPKAASDQIVAPTGGQYYAREAPDAAPFIREGDRFEVGQPLFIIEVMKMLNTITAPFSGRVVKNLMEGHDGHVVLKAQPILIIEPDETVVIESDEERDERRRKTTAEMLAPLVGPGFDGFVHTA